MDLNTYLLPLNSKGEKVSKRREIVKWVMKITISLFFILWISTTFVYPLESAEAWIEAWTDATSASFLGFTGSAFVLFSGPLIVISLISVLYLAIYSDESHLKFESRKGKRASYRMWTWPVIVGGPFGVVSAAELIGIGLVCAYVVWVAGVYAFQKLSKLFVDPDYTTFEKWSWVFRMSGRGCGLAGIFCLPFVFIAIARASPLLQMLNISQEHGVRYHIWLANLCMCLFTSHGFLYLTGWFMSGEIPSELISWTPTDGANLAGIINIFFGWTIWITSLPFVRRKNFELFYYTHHLYILFTIFLAMHVGNFFFCIVAGSIFLFMIDRFLRLCQSRKTVDTITATSFPCGVVQLVMPIPSSLQYSALSTIFVRIKELSWLQYHPFSVSNSRLDGKNHLCVLIKDCGNWTSQLGHNALNCKVAKELHLNHSTTLTASVEGPYGYRFSYHLAYEHLILVAGGIGITPFMAVLSDVFYRIKKDEPCLPRNIVLIWAIKTQDELSLLSTVDMASDRSIPFNDLHLQILIYVTQQSQPLSENGAITQPVVSASIGFGSTRNSISTLTSTANRGWFATYLISSTFSLVALISIVNLLYVRPYEIVNWWFQALLLLACMLASVLFFGGAIIRLWKNSEKDNASTSIQQISNDEFNLQSATNNSFLEYFGGSTIIHYASRPDFKEIFGLISTKWGNVDAGVMVCGPRSLQESVATECRSLNFKRQSHQTVFHFHSHSFST